MEEPKSNSQLEQKRTPLLEAALKTTEKDQQEYKSMCFTSKMLLMHLLKLQCVELLNGLCIVGPKCISLLLIQQHTALGSWPEEPQKKNKEKRV